MAGPSFRSIHSWTVGRVSSSRAWPSMSWKEQHTSQWGLPGVLALTFSNITVGLTVIIRTRQALSGEFALSKRVCGLFLSDTALTWCLLLTCLTCVKHEWSMWSTANRHHSLCINNHFLSEFLPSTRPPAMIHFDDLRAVEFVLQCNVTLSVASHHLQAWMHSSMMADQR